MRENVLKVCLIAKNSLWLQGGPFSSPQTLYPYQPSLRSEGFAPLSLRRQPARLRYLAFRFAHPATSPNNQWIALIILRPCYLVMSRFTVFDEL